MRDEWSGADTGALTDWLDRTLGAEDDPELGDINYPSAIEISNAPSGPCIGLTPVTISLPLNVSVSDVETALFEKLHQILDRYPRVRDPVLRLSPRIRGLEGGLGPGGEAFILRLHRKNLPAPNRDRMDETFSKMDQNYSKMNGDLPDRTPAPDHVTASAWRNDTVLSSMHMMIDTLVGSADRASRQEGYMGGKLAQHLEVSSEHNVKALEAARSDMVTILQTNAAQQITLARDLATATATLVAEQGTNRTNERLWTSDRARLDARINSLEAELAGEREEHLASVESVGGVSAQAEGFKRRAIVAERQNVEMTARYTDLTERYNKLVRDRNKLRKATSSGDEGMGGMLAMFQQFMATQKGGEGVAAAPVAPAPVVQEEEEEDPDAELLEQPPIIGIGAIRPVKPVLRRAAVKRTAKKPVRSHLTTPSRTIPAKPTPAPASGGFDLGMLASATPEQVAAIFQMLPSRTVNGALSALAEKNPTFAKSIKSNLSTALGEDEDEDEELEEEGGLDDLLEGLEGEEEEVEEDDEVDPDEDEEEGEE